MHELHYMSITSDTVIYIYMYATLHIYKVAGLLRGLLTSQVCITSFALSSHFLRLYVVLSVNCVTPFHVKLDVGKYFYLYTIGPVIIKFR